MKDNFVMVVVELEFIFKELPCLLMGIATVMYSNVNPFHLNWLYHLRLIVNVLSNRITIFI